MVLRLARENAWGSTRILGELKKPGIGAVSRTTIATILHEHGFDPGPQRGERSWDAYVKRHAQTIWACDFVTKKVWTSKGLRDHFVLFFIHLGSRRVFVSGITDRPSAEWVTQQARNFCWGSAKQRVAYKIVRCLSRGPVAGIRSRPLPLEPLKISRMSAPNRFRWSPSSRESSAGLRRCARTCRCAAP